MRNVYFKFLVMLHILFLDITEHEWFSRSYYPTLEMNKIKQNRLFFPLMTIFQFFFCRWVGSRKRKVQSHFWWTGPDFCWNVWLLKNHPAANSPPPPPPSISWFLYKIFREIIFTKNLHYFPLYTPPILLLPSPKNCTFNIPYFVVLLFSYYLLKKKNILSAP